MLPDQHVAGLFALGIHATDVGHHVALEQVEQTPNGVQQNGVVAGLGNRQVKTRIGRTLLGASHLADSRVAILQGFERFGEALPIDIGGAPGRVVGAGAFQRVTKFQQIALGVFLVLQQLQQRVAEGRAE